MQDRLFENEPSLSEDMSNILTEVTALRKSENAQVALKARQVLIASKQPAFELRRNQIESIFLSAVDNYGHQVHQENLQVLL